jgi:hypothetical protein
MLLEVAVAAFPLAPRGQLQQVAAASFDKVCMDGLLQDTDEFLQESDTTLSHASAICLAASGVDPTCLSSAGLLPSPASADVLEASLVSPRSCSPAVDLSPRSAMDVF